MAEMSLRDAAAAVVRRLRAHGHVAYFAGGCVRDMLLGREPKDFDIATDAQPPRIVELFTRTRKVGMKFGVVLVRQARHWIEVATFRTDLSYSDGRRPDGVRFSTPEEDAQRRDFTINGMFFDPVEERVIDFVGGRADLASRTLRAIGEPRQRFTEDHLRVLRAVRFAAAYECAIEPNTWQAIRDMAHTIRGVSAERVREELEKCLASPTRARAFGWMAEAGLLPHLWEGAVWTDRSATAVRAILAELPPDAPFEVCLAAILHDRAPEEVHRICRALTCSNRTREGVAWMLAQRPRLAEPDRLTPADLKLLMQSPWFEPLLILFAAVCRAEGRSLAAHEELCRRAGAVAPEDVRPEPFVNGDDLKRMRLKQGPEFSEVLDRVYYAQLNGELPTREDALQMASRLVAEIRARSG